MTAEPPMPPLALAQRVGSLPDGTEPLAVYDRIGRTSREQILRMLPEGWDFAGRRALDFGCGAGRTLRHFIGEADAAEIWGCDIDEPSIAWVRDRLCPPLHAFVSRTEPPLPQPDAGFDLIWAISVFTHLTESWSRWLLELHRVLADDGLVIVTYMGERLSEELGAGPWDEDRVGMNALYAWQGWELGGPFVFHSHWWVRAHWGRAFEFVAVDTEPVVEGELSKHSWALLRKRPIELTPEDLERPEPGEPRELAAIRHNLRQVQAEAGRIAEERRHLRRRVSELDELVDRLNAGIDGWEARVREYESSLSWRLTRPLRAARRLVRRRRSE
jgi:SAM-dependent methyltransferase